MVLQDKAFLERLRLLKDKSGMTTKEIAVMDIIKAMGGKASDVFDDNAQVNTQLKVPQAVISDIEKKNIEVVELYERIIKSKDKTIKLLTCVLLGLASVIIFLLLFDLFNGGIGYFQK
mgnify:CR=1 FL=1